MATEHVKVYEEKKGLPLWAWLLPLLLLLALLAYFLLHRNHAVDTTAVPVATPVATTAAATMPDLGAVHFDTDKATLTPEGQATLTKAADYMKQNPATHLRIEGFTDATGTEPHNNDLSVQRAMASADFLQSKGIDRTRLTGGGFGAGKPVDTNATTNGKADNRRVELFQQ